MNDLPNLQESTILHAARCAAAAKSAASRRYWSKVLEDAIEQYRARGGERISLDKSDPARWKIKVNPAWLSPDDKSVPPITSKGAAVVLDEEPRDPAAEDAAHAALMRRLAAK
jgi:hypothetical protein